MLPFSSHFTTTTRIPAITALAALVPCAHRRDQAHVARGLAAVAVVRADGQQAGELALAPALGCRLTAW